MAWSNDRKDELKQLNMLLGECAMLNNATGALDRLARINTLAKKLTQGDLDTGRDSFAQFLVQQAAVAA